MDLKITDFEIPRGMEDSFGKDPRSIVAIYEEDAEKEYVMIEYEFFLESAKGRTPLDETRTRNILGPEDADLGSVLDFDGYEPGSQVVLRYRRFDGGSSCGPHDEISRFDIKVPAKGKEVTKLEYNDIMKKKIEEMREMYGGRGRGGRN